MRLDDACDILGVVRVRDPHTRLPRIQGTRDEAQKLYRKLAMLHHPDRRCAPWPSTHSRIRRPFLPTSAIHPDCSPGRSCGGSSDPGATAKFQSVGEAWERVQQFHDQGFGFEATLAENPRPSSASAGGPTSWRDHFNSWWAGGGGGGGGGGDYGGGYGGGYGEPRECSANCQCSFCMVTAIALASVRTLAPALASSLARTLTLASALTLAL